MASEVETLVVGEDELADSIARVPGDAKIVVRYTDTELSFAVSRRRNPRLVIVFQGAVKPGRPTADFDTSALAQQLDATVISIAEPSLVRSANLATSWYAGHEGFPAQRILVDSLHRIQRALDVTRPIYVGGSSGGFAALYYSWHTPGSVAVAVNPQTSLERHLPKPVREYRLSCWPALPADASLSDVIDQDLTVLYGEKVPNAVVYLQNSMDPFHLRNHLGPFLSSIRQADYATVVTEVGFWGKFGHSGSIPRKIWYEWTRVALDASSISATDLLACREQPVREVATNERRAASDDTSIARRIADLVRRNR